MTNWTAHCWTTKKDKMKTVLSLMGMALLFACGAGKEIQVDFVSAELVKIDTVYRYPNNYQQVLTWKGAENNVQYVSYASLNNSYSIGSRMLVMVKK
jgi:hypothetical protein